MDFHEQTLSRILAHCQQEPNGCLIWQGARYGGGYGKAMVAGKIYRVHRLVYELVVGPIPEGMVLLHSCDTPACCEPGHLRAGTHQENMADAGRKGRMSVPHENSRVFYGASMSDPADVAERLASIVARTDSGCLEWQGRTDPDGYGRLRFDGNGYSPHRLAWVLAHGEIPQGQVLLHECDNRKCCKVDHMRLGTQAENIRDAKAKGRLHSGDVHWSSKKAYPNSGDLHYSKARPESFALRDPEVRAKATRNRSGDNHWAKRDPEKARASMKIARETRLARGDRPANCKLTEDQVRDIRAKCASGVYQESIAKEYSVSVATVQNIVYRKTWKHVL